MTAPIDIHKLRKSFGRVRAVDGLTLDVPEGQVTALLGPNGAGKTTTIKCTLNLLLPDSGSTKVLGVDSRRLGPEQFQRIGYVSENQELPRWMTVRQYLDYCRPMYPSWDIAFEAKLMRDFDLPPETRLKDLSRGMRMKAALLSSLAYHPKLVVLDEPFAGLDPLVRDEFVRGLLELTEEAGWTVFISSHDIDEVERLADRVAIIDRGRLQLSESVERLQARFRTVEVEMAEGQSPPDPAPSQWLNLERAGRLIRFVHSDFSDASFPGELAEHLAGALRYEARPMTLREIFVALARTYRLSDSTQVVHQS